MRSLLAVAATFALTAGLFSAQAPQSASATTFVSTPSMPTAPGVKGGEQPNGGNLALYINPSTGATWRIAESGAIVWTPSSAFATYQNTLASGYTSLAVDAGDNTAWISGSNITKIGRFNAGGSTLTYYSVPLDPSGLTDVSLTHSATSGLTTTLSSATPAICTVTGNAVSNPVSGYCTLEVRQAGNAAFYPAPTLTRTFVVTGQGASRTQTVAFTQPSNQAVGTTVPFVSTASSNLPVTMTSLTPDVCTASGLSVTMISRGSCTIAARQNGSAEYIPAETQRTFTVDSGATGTTAQTLTFVSTANVRLDDVTRTLGPVTASSGLPVTVTNLTPAVCTLQNNNLEVALNARGQCRISYYQGGNSTYAAAESIVVSNVSGWISGAASPAGPSDQTVSLSSTSNRTLPTLTGWGNMAVSSTTHHAYILNPGRKSVFKFDLSTLTWTELSLSSVATGGALTEIAVDTANNRLLITDSGLGKVHVVDVTNMAVGTSLSTGSGAWGISLDESRSIAYVANSTAGTVSVVDYSGSLAITQTLTLTTYMPKLTAIDPVNQWLYVGSTTTGVAVVDIQNNNAIYETPGNGVGIRALAANPIAKTASYTTTTVTGGSYVASGTIGYIPDITSAAPADGTYNVNYSGHQMTAIGSPGSVYSKTAGTMPPGLSISSSGAISGKPTSPGIYTFTITANNGFGTDAEQYTIHVPVPAPTLSNMTFADGYEGEAYVDSTQWNLPTYSLTNTWLASQYAANGIAPFRVTAGSLPTGLSLNGQTGEITGTASAQGTYNFTVTGTNNSLARTNATNQTATQSYQIVIQPPRPPVIEPTLDWEIQWSYGSNPMPPFEGGGQSWTNWLQPYLASGSPAATWSISAGSLPAGLQWANDRVSGHVTAAAGTAYSFTVRATAANGLYDEMTFAGTVSAAPPSFNGTTLTAFVGVPFFFNPWVNFGWYQAGSGSTPMTWAQSQTTQHQLPAGLALNSATGVVSGTPTSGALTGGNTGTYYVDVDVANSAGTTTPSYTYNVLPAPTATQTITVVEGASIPAGTYPAVPQSATQPGSSPWWNPVLGGNVPSWLTIDDANGNGTGELIGAAPSASAGTYTFVLAYYDSGWNTNYLVVDLVVVPTPPAMAATTQISANAGASFATPIANTGGAAAACAPANSTSLPTGVTLSVSAGQCVLNGTSSVAVGTYTFDVEASNTGANSVAQTSVTSVTLTIQSVPVISSPLSLYWVTGLANSYTVSPSAGATPFAFALASGAPNWSGVNASSGVLTATPPTATTGSLDVNITNSASGPSNPTVLTVNYTSLVAPVLPTVTIPAPTVGTTYTTQNPLYTVPAPTSGTGPFTYVATGLPAGLTINSATGSITGTATSTTAGSVVVTVANSTAYTAYQSAPSTVSSSLIVSTSAQSVTPVVLAPVYPATISRIAAASSAFAYTPSLSSGSPATAWQLASSSSLPSWLSLNATTGELTGTAPATAQAPVSFTVEASNATAPLSSIVYTLEVQVAPSGLSIAPPTPTVGVAYSYTLPAPSTGTGPFSYTISPANALTGTGLSLVNGVITGTPTANGVSAAFTIVANNALTTQNGTGAASSASTTLTNAVVAPAFSPSTLSCPSANLAQITGCVPTQTSTTTPATNYTVSWSPSTPAGVSFNTTAGAIGGTPTVPGTYTATVTGWTGAGGTGSSGSVAVTLNATAAPVVTATNSGFSYGVSSSFTLNSTASNPAPNSFTTASAPNAAPNWITINPTTGAISGTPPLGTASPVTFNVVVANGVGTPTVVPVSIALTYQAPQLASTTTLPVIAPGSTGSTLVSPNPLAVTGGSPGTYTLGTNSSGVGNTAPSWISINSATGVVSYTNATATPGTYTFPVTVTNPTGSATTTVSITVADIPILPATLSFNIPVGTAWTHDFASDITSTNGPFSGWQIASSSTAPSWANATGLLDATAGSRTGVISGTPSAAGTDTFTVEVQNANSAGVPSTVLVTVNALVAPTWATAPTTPNVTTGVFYSYQFPAPSSGTGPFTFQATGLPSGLQIDPVTGIISGTVLSTTSATVNSNFTVTATNALGSASAGSVTPLIAVSTVAPTLPSTLNLNATTTSPFSYTFAPTGGSPVVSYSAPSSGAGAMPGVLSFTGAVLGGQFTTQGTHTFTVTADAGSSITSTVAVTITVVQPPIVTAQVTAPTAPTGSLYTYPSTGSIASNTTGTTTYLVTSGTLPSWATLNANGTITGTPTGAGGPTVITVTATNSAGSSTQQITLSSAVPPTAIAGSALSPVVGQPLTTSFVPSAGTGPFSYQLTAGSLPAGVTLGSNGVLVGAPTSAGSGSFTISVTGPGGTATSSMTFTTTVAAPVFAATVTKYATATQLFTHTFVHSSGSPASSFSLTSGFPSALALNTATGVHSGTPLVSDIGTHTGTLTGTNSGGSGTSAYTLIVLGMPVLPATTSAAGAMTGTGYTLPITATGSSLGTLTYSVSAGSLPTGLTLNPATGAITGTPTQSSSSTVTFTVTATNQAGTAVSTVVTLPVTAPTVSSPAGSSSASGALSRSSSISPAAPLGSTGTTSLGSSGASSGASTLNTSVVPKVSASVGQSVTAIVPGITGKTVTFSVATGQLPAGLSLNPNTGAITGTASTAGSFTVTIKVTANDGTVEYREMTIAVSEPASNAAQPISDSSWIAVTALTISGLLLLGLLLWFLIARRRKRESNA